MGPLFKSGIGSHLSAFDLPYLAMSVEGQMLEQDKDHELGAHAEKLVDQIKADLEYDEEGKSFFKKEKILNLVFKVTDFMRQLSKRI